MDPQKAHFLEVLNAQVIYLMGGSFLLGSLFTIFVLLILEMIRARHDELPPPEDNIDV